MAQIVYGSSVQQEAVGGKYWPPHFPPGTAEGNDDMGKITTTITVKNLLDDVLASQGAITLTQVRAVTLENVICDTGATHLCLPPEVIAQLGLTLKQEVDIRTARGMSKARIFEGGKVILQDRSSTSEIIELPGGRDPLLGVIPMEAMGVELDLMKQELRLLPMNGPDTYLLAY